MTASLSSWVIEMQFTTDVWTDITSDVMIQDLVRSESGMGNNSPTDRVARTGRLQFSLNNSSSNSAGLAGYYSPGHNNVRSGFATGIPVRCRVSYDGYTRTKFYGRIAKDGIKTDTGSYGNRRTKITVLDWMNQASTHKLILPAYTTNKRIDEIVPLIVSNMPLAPLSTDYDTGVETFISVFDTVRSRTSAMSELKKLAMSEWGFIYITHDKDNDEILRVENQNARDSTVLSTIPDMSTEAGYLLMDSGDYLLQDNGDRIILEVAESTDFFNDTAVNPIVSYGKHMANYVTVTSHPRRFDTAATVLYSTTSPLSLDSGETRTFTGNFRDPNNEAVRVACAGTVPLVATTDYWLNTSNAGTGADMTADMVIVGSVGANAGSYSITNNNVSDGYGSVQVRGTGIYLYDEIEYLSQGTASQAAHGLQTLDVDMPYQDEPAHAESIANWLVLYLRDPRQEVDKYPFYANRDDEHLTAFVHLEIGNRIHITETQSGFNRDVFIDAINFEIHPNNVVKCTYATRFVSALVGWQLEIVGYGELEETTILG